MDHTVLAVGHACNTDTGMLHYYPGSWPYHDRIPYNAEDHGRDFSYLLDFSENRVYGYCRIEYGFVGMHLSDITDFETDIDYIEVFGLCFIV